MSKIIFCKDEIKAAAGLLKIDSELSKIFQKYIKILNKKEISKKLTVKGKKVLDNKLKEKNLGRIKNLININAKVEDKNINVKETNAKLETRNNNIKEINAKVEDNKICKNFKKINAKVEDIKICNIVKEINAKLDGKKINNNVKEINAKVEDKRLNINKKEGQTKNIKNAKKIIKSTVQRKNIKETKKINLEINKTDNVIKNKISHFDENKKRTEKSIILEENNYTVDFNNIENSKENHYINDLNNTKNINKNDFINNIDNTKINNLDLQEESNYSNSLSIEEEPKIIKTVKRASAKMAENFIIKSVEIDNKLNVKEEPKNSKTIKRKRKNINMPLKKPKKTKTIESVKKDKFKGYNEEKINNEICEDEKNDLINLKGFNREKQKINEKTILEEHKNNNNDLKKPFLNKQNNQYLEKQINNTNEEESITEKQNNIYSEKLKTKNTNLEESFTEKNNNSEKLITEKIGINNENIKKHSNINQKFIDTTLILEDTNTQKNNDSDNKENFNFTKSDPFISKSSEIDDELTRIKLENQKLKQILELAKLNVRGRIEAEETKIEKPVNTPKFEFVHPLIKQKEERRVEDIKKEIESIFPKIQENRKNENFDLKKNDYYIKKNEIEHNKNNFDIKKKEIEHNKNNFDIKKNNFDNIKNNIYIKNNIKTEHMKNNFYIKKDYDNIENKKNNENNEKKIVKKEIKIIEKEKKLEPLKAIFPSRKDLLRKVLDDDIKKTPIKKNFKDPNLYVSKMKLPEIDSNDKVDPSYVLPEWTKDENLNSIVKAQNNLEIERYFQSKEELDIVKMFPDQADATNDSPNKWQIRKV